MCFLLHVEKKKGADGPRSTPQTEKCSKVVVFFYQTPKENIMAILVRDFSKVLYLVFVFLGIIIILNVLFVLLFFCMKHYSTSNVIESLIFSCASRKQKTLPVD